MKFFEKRIRRAVAVFLVAVFAFFISPFSASAAVANTINFQGRFLSGPSEPLANTTLDIRFSLWGATDAPDGGAYMDGSGNLIDAPWEELTTVTTDSQGFFMIEVGLVNPLPAEFDADFHKYLQAEVKQTTAAATGFVLLDPLRNNDSIDRKPIAGSVYAQNAKLLDGHGIGTSAGEIPFLNAEGEFDRNLLGLDKFHDPVADTTAMNALSVEAGTLVFVVAENSLYTFNGTSWDKIGGDLSNSLENLTSDVTANTNAITALGNRITTAESDIDNLENEIDGTGGLKERTTALETTTADHETRISANEAAIDDRYTKNYIDTLQGNLESEIDINKTAIENRYTKSEVDNKINEVVSGLSWRDSVATLADLITTYPNAANGWTAYVSGLGEIYTYDGSNWIKTGADLQEATETVAGKVKLAADGEVAENKVIQSTDSRITQIGTNETNIATNLANITTNSGNITTNSANISTNVTNISDNSTAIGDNSTEITKNQTDINTLNNFASEGFDVFILSGF